MWQNQLIIPGATWLRRIPGVAITVTFAETVKLQVT